VLETQCQETQCHPTQRTHCNAMQHAATQWSTVQHTATHYNTLQHKIVCWKLSARKFSATHHTRGWVGRWETQCLGTSVHWGRWHWDSVALKLIAISDPPNTPQRVLCVAKRCAVLGLQKKDVRKYCSVLQRVAENLGKSVPAFTGIWKTQIWLGNPRRIYQMHWVLAGFSSKSFPPHK